MIKGVSIDDPKNNSDMTLTSKLPNCRHVIMKYIER